MALLGIIFTIICVCLFVYGIEGFLSGINSPIIIYTEQELKRDAVPVDVVKQLLPDEEITDIDGYFYTKNIGGHHHMKLLIKCHDEKNPYNEIDVVPVDEVKQLHPDEEITDIDGYFYTRNIGGYHHRKLYVKSHNVCGEIDAFPEIKKYK